MSTYLYSAFDCRLLSCHVWEYQRPPCYKQSLFRVHLRTKLLWARIPFQSLKLQIWLLFRARSSLTFVCIHSEPRTWHNNMDLNVRYTNCTNWVYELSSCGFVSRRSAWNSDMAPALCNEFLDMQANCRVWIHFEPRTWYGNSTCSQF